jgi:hypothetical protein
MFDTLSDMADPGAADALRLLRDSRPTTKMGVRPGQATWTELTYIDGVDVSDLMDALRADRLVVNTQQRGWQLTDRGWAVADRLGPDGWLDLPLPPDPAV